jgi:hypothetical protein
LESLNLTSTAVTDKAIDELVQMPRLKTLCLGSVKISQAGIDKLKAHARTQGRDLQLGYSEKK